VEEPSDEEAGDLFDLQAILCKKKSSKKFKNRGSNKLTKKISS
jgi:hypothetical protein